jgi:predicted enzyme related to lactoylglutathione lyase
MTRVTGYGLAAALIITGLAAPKSAGAQETGIRVRSVRVLASDPEALARFYEHAFGMSETRRPPVGGTQIELVVNSGSTTEIAKKSATTPIVIMTRPANSPAGAMASLILEVPDLEKALELVKANGGAQLRPATKSGEGLTYAFVKDPDGNQIELVMSPK